MTIRLKGLASMAVGAFICAMLVSCTGLGPSDELVTPSDEPVTLSDESVTQPDEPVTQPGPNLVVWSPSVSNSAPAVGATFNVSATVRNDGNEASGATTMRFYRSTDATITTSDTEVGMYVVTGLDTAGSSSQTARSGSHTARMFATSEPGTYYYHGEVEVTAPSTAGTYYYGACVDAVTDESETTNNCSSSVRVTVRSSDTQVQGTSDLETYSIVAWTGVGLIPGVSFDLSASVRNTGSGSSAGTTLRYYQSTDATVTTSDTEVGTAEVPALAPSGTSTQSLSLNAPSTPGTYYYGACVDTVTDESDTTNNCSSAVQVTVAELQEPDGLPRVRIYSTSGAVTEGMPARFRVTATPPPAANLEVKIAFAEVALTEDELILFYPPAEKTVTVNAGASSTTLTVDTIDDSDDDGNSWIHAWVNRGIGYTTDYDDDDVHSLRAAVIVAVVDDDGPAGDSVLSITPVEPSVSEGTAVEVTISATPPPTAEVTVRYRMSETGNTLTASLVPGWTPGTVTLSADQSTATLTFATDNDSTDEEDSEVVVSLHVDTIPDGVTIGEPSIAYVTVLDDG